MKQLHLFKDTEIYQLTDPKNREEIIKTNPYLGHRSKSMGYKRYISSKEWKNKKKFAIQLADYKCEFCNEKGYLEVHHSNYECLYNERFNDVFVLCEECHKEEDENRRFFTAYGTYLRKKYGVDWHKFRNEDTMHEFKIWLEEKERYEDYF